MTTPDWLKARGGELTKGIGERSWHVTLSGDPQWRLDAVPAKGTFSCAIVQANNGKRLDGSQGYPSAEAALAGGLDEIRSKLGW